MLKPIREVRLIVKAVVERICERPYIGRRTSSSYPHTGINRISGDDRETPPKIPSHILATWITPIIVWECDRLSSKHLCHGYTEAWRCTAFQLGARWTRIQFWPFPYSGSSGALVTAREAARPSWYSARSSSAMPWAVGFNTSFQTTRLLKVNHQFGDLMSCGARYAAAELLTIKVICYIITHYSEFNAKAVTVGENRHYPFEVHVF